MEMELPAFVCNFGIIGFILYFGPFAVIMGEAFGKAWKNRKKIKIDTVMNLTELALGKKYIPLFTRNKISNKKEQTDMVIECSSYLDNETILKHLPFLSSDEISTILKNKEAEDYEQFNDGENKANNNGSNNDLDSDDEDIITE